MTTETQTKCRPILFTGEMVNAILDGRKTQTRRIVSSRNSTVNGYPAKSYWPNLLFEHAVTRTHNPLIECIKGRRGDSDAEDVHLGVPWRHPDESHLRPDECGIFRVRPKYEPGDLLWVREAWSPDHAAFYPHYPIVYRADGYPAASDIECGHIESPEAGGKRYPFRWRPSIHLRAVDARLRLRLTDVRAQRVQEISEEDAIAEGLSWWSKDGILKKWGPSKRHVSGELDFVWPWQEMPMSHTGAMERLWNSIHGPHAWERNDWVWALTFERCDDGR